jgi:hypothetical protein
MDVFMKEKMTTIKGLCAFIENDPPPPVKSVGVRSCNAEDSHVFLTVEFSGEDSYCNSFRDYIFDDVDVWRRLGKAVQGIHLQPFEFRDGWNWDSDIDITPSAGCLNALFNQLK